MPHSLRPASRPNYQTPKAFLELEAEYQRQERKHKAAASGKGGGGGRAGNGQAPKKRIKVARGSGPRDSGHGASGVDDEEDQLASSSDANDEDTAEEEEEDEDLDEKLLAMADQLNRAVSGHGKPKRARKSTAGAGKKRTGAGRNAPRKVDPLKKLGAGLFTHVISFLPPASLPVIACVSSSYRALMSSDALDAVWEGARDAEGLPDLVQGEWEWYERGYAELVWGKTCSMCAKRSTHWPDAFLRVRLCKPCRETNMVALKDLAETHPELHGAAKDCVIRSRQKPSEPHQHLKKPAYALLSSLQAHSDVLWELQQLDDEDDEVYYAEVFAASTLASPDRRKGSGSGIPSNRGRYDEGPRRKEGEWGENVAESVGERRAKRDKVEKEGEALFAALAPLYARHAAADGAQAAQPSIARRQAIEARVLALDTDDNWCQDDFIGPWLTNKVVNHGSDVISDSDWADLKPQVLKILASSRKKRKAAEATKAQHERREALLPAYQAFRLKQSSATGVIWTPLFADWLLWPSVRALWQPHDAVVDEAAIAAAQEGMDEDLNDWRVGLRLHVIKLVLSNTLDIADNEELDTDADAYDADEYDDDFLALLSSHVLCSIEGCYRTAKGHKGSPDYEPAQHTYFGSLVDVLCHQHEAHDSLEPSAKDLARPVDREPRYRVALPLEVFCTVVAMCELAGLDDEKATAEDLDDVLAAEGAFVQWANTPGGGHGKKEEDFRAVICSIYRAVVKAAHSRPPRSIGIPMIALNPGKG
ncbi:hypothetical protein DMC30DRAFT_253860 [Rhodotorula diobovata]|uniref:F-box domain-containing protein n=1 Tax=Rhodotorula diobovata TaxID=5288 RepID=A0A5C5FW62_9BASI|nr:hypothetical protein DMC30DRAFT_253860 [Rhodotorula diobovata]